eukprot:TRINITY_DN11090_c0_g1_i15.p1 TRINITY_DN11090_c0_g1~~TRINITY_DN11090_c0_g1_i15.p1  ORF type:complete len:845 (+),score=135.43 TRINITY_DN11090_c0_g1_i15:84-2618(+)
MDFISELHHDDLLAVGEDHYLLARQGKLAVIPKKNPTVVLRTIPVGKPNLPMRMKIGKLKNIVAISSGSTIKLFNYVDAEELYNHKSGSPITSIAWSMCSPYVFCFGTQSRRIHQIDSRGVGIKSRPNCWTSCLAYCPSEDTLASGSEAGQLRIVVTLTKHRTLNIAAHKNARIHSLVWSPSNPTELLTCSDSPKEGVKLWYNTAYDGAQLPRLVAIPAVNADYSPTGRGVVTASNVTEDGMADIQLWQLDKPDVPVRTLRGHPQFGWSSEGDAHVLVLRTTSGIQTVPLAEMLNETVPSDSTLLHPQPERMPLWRDMQEDAVSRPKTFAEQVNELRHTTSTHVNFVRSNYHDFCEVNLIFPRGLNQQTVVAIAVKTLANDKALFELLEATTLDTRKKARLLQVLNDTYKDVKQGESQAAWLAPCLRAAVDHIQHGQLSRVLTQDEEQQRLLKGHRPVLAKQLKRSCGAVFAANGQLIVFTNSILAQPTDDSSAKTTGTTVPSGGESPNKINRPRGTSIAQRHEDAGRSGSVSSRGMLFRLRGIKKQASNTAETTAAVAFQRKRLANKVEVIDACAAMSLQPVQQDAMMKLMRRDDDDICQRFASTSLKAKQYDQAQYWRVVGLALQLTTTLSASQWMQHPCGGRFVTNLLTNYHRHRHTQSLAQLCLVLSRYTLAAKAPIANPAPRQAMAKTNLNPAQQALVSEFFGMKPSDSFEQQRTNLLKAILDIRPKLRAQLRAYADVLRAWHRPLDAAILLQVADVKVDSPDCSHVTAVDATRGVMKCSVCRLPCALFAACPICQHGGHYQHLKAWFSTHSVCAVNGCGCDCPRQAYNLPEVSGLVYP